MRKLFYIVLMIFIGLLIVGCASDERKVQGTWTNGANFSVVLKAGGNCNIYHGQDDITAIEVISCSWSLQNYELTVNYEAKATIGIYSQTKTFRIDGKFNDNYTQWIYGNAVYTRK